MQISDEFISEDVEYSDVIKYLIPKWNADWNKFAFDVLGAKLDTQQEEILHAIQNSRRVSVRSGNARGKDYVAAVASLCFLLLNIPSKVINTAPTGRQVRAIMMPEIANMYKKAQTVIDPGGRLLSESIKFLDERHYLIGFKAGDRSIESWSGFHSPNIMVVVTEASGIDDITFTAIEGVLQGNSKLVIVFNPNRLSGEAYKSTRQPIYESYRLNCLDAPNVINYKKMLDGKITQEKYDEIAIPGQVDYLWIDEKIKTQGWVTQVRKDEMIDLDFKWNDNYYRPGDLFKIKVLGEFPDETEDVLIPIHWIEAAQQRWLDIPQNQKDILIKKELLLGSDIAGMGNDKNCFAHRYDDFVHKIVTYPNKGKRETIHMETAGRIKNLIKKGGYSFIDTIGEGAGVYSRLVEQGVENAISAKASENAKGLFDKTGVRTFANMRAYMFWTLRDALDPQFNSTLALPIDDELTQELTEIRWFIQSNGSIILEPKDDIKERIGRSPDKSDSLGLTFYPMQRVRKKATKYVSKDQLGFH